MSQTTTPDGSGHQENAPVRQGAASGPRRAVGSSPGETRRARVVSLAAGSMLCLFALVLLAGGNVEVRGDASATLPGLPWLAGGFLIIGGAAGLIGAWVLARAIRR